ncbi:MAG: ABC transporter substrate-binding protein [Azospirillum sp.]|nr:ABC transporter substrate-binding protein [Azospirillum sp.]
MRLFAAVTAILIAALPAVSVARADDVLGAPAVTLHGTPKYQPGFDHLDYADPAAPKGGEIKLSAIGSFDSLNPYILRGVGAAGLGLAFETLTTQTLDEPFSEYGLIAETIDIPADRAWVAYTLRSQARWHDGQPITAEDVVWSFEALKEKGHPFYRSYYAEVAKAEADGPARVKFTFKRPGNSELPLIMGQMPVMPKHYWASRDFASTTLEPPLGSGPYRIETVEPGRAITLQRVADWWGRELPINRGRYNFDRIRYDYYRDAGVALEAFLAGAYDYRQENSAKTWATGYDAPPVRDGLIVKREIKHERPAGMQAFVFNSRREIFKDPRVREALGYAFDFEWANRNVAYGAYKRTESYFANSELASSGLPSKDELAILEPFRDRLPPRLFTEEFHPPKTDASGNARGNLRKATELLAGAGWVLRDNQLVNAANGKPLTFEILYPSPLFEPWVGPFIANLKRLGITARYRVVDDAQYQNLIDDFNFDMTIGGFGQSLSPGNEQLDFWGSTRAAIKGSRNIAGVNDPVVDHLIDLIVQAPDRASLITRVRALDRVLLWGFYVIPQWHLDRDRLAYWDKFGAPLVTPKYGLGVIDTWWLDAAKAPSIRAVQGRHPAP